MRLIKCSSLWLRPQHIKHMLTFPHLGAKEGNQVWATDWGRDIDRDRESDWGQKLEAPLGAPHNPKDRQLSCGRVTLHMLRSSWARKGKAEEEEELSIITDPLWKGTSSCQSKEVSQPMTSAPWLTSLLWHFTNTTWDRRKTAASLTKDATISLFKIIRFAGLNAYFIYT